MITNLRAAQLCAAIYTTPTDFPIYDAGEDDGVCWALSREDDVDVVVLRGSVTFRDWLRDFLAVANPYASRRLGPVHAGFYLGLDNAWTDIKPMLRKGAPLVLTGHSLGAARASILTGVAILDSMPPAARIVFGEPKPGFQQLGDFIGPVPAWSFRNGNGSHHDLVTDVPFTLPPVDYVHPTKLFSVCAEPEPIHELGIFAWHSIALYVKALSNPATVPQPI